MAKDKKPTAKAQAPPEPPPGQWECSACGQENDGADMACCACEEARPPAPSPSGGDRYAGYVVGIVTSCELVPKKDRLSVVKVDVGGAEELQVVTNAPNVSVGMRVVVATVGAVFRGDNGEDDTVRRGAVGGVMSAGMLCNSAMLGWKGGDSKTAVALSDAFAVGTRPPETRPRTD